jgi:hypothetical protein
MLFERYVSDNILNNSTYKKCSDAIEDLMNNNSNLFDYSNIFFFTGKDANDIGSERECLDREGTYLILGFKHYKNQTFYNNEIERIKLISFLYQQTTFIGVCLDKCSDFILNAFFGENTKLSVMEDDLKINYVYKNYTLPEKENENKNKTIYNYYGREFIFDRAGFVFISFRLGLQTLDESYYNIIPIIFSKIHNNIGFVSGKKNRAYYFVGYNGDGKLIFADPHFNQKVEEYNDNLLSYNVPELYILKVNELSGELTLGIAISDLDDFKLLVEDLEYLSSNFPDFIRFK